MKIGEVVDRLHAGERVRRACWPAATFICYVPGLMLAPDSTAAVRKFLAPAVDLKCGGHVIVSAAGHAWDASIAPSWHDVMALDWEVFEEAT